MKEIVLDTETTGLDAQNGDRLVEIGCVELLNHVETGQYFHAYLNPGISMPEKAEKIHGLSDSFLKDKPVFVDVVEDFLDFIKDSKLIIHNASFDLGFLNMELEKCSQTSISSEQVIDTLMIARKKFPGAPANLDALCRRFEIDLSDRLKHGALLDAKLLATVYLELIGGRQPGLTLDSLNSNTREKSIKHISKNLEFDRTHTPSPDEIRAHELFINSLPNPIWKKTP